jgi:hypothetical protein
MKNNNLLQEELFKAIVIDRDNKNFKVISGDFKDKKDLSDTYVDDFIIRKVYKKEVFEWILKNARSSLDAYILLSTSYKKWVNKDITRDYYYKIRQDLPILTYEESNMKEFIKQVIQEAADTINHDDLLNVDLTNNTVNLQVEVFVKGLLGKKDSIIVEVPFELGTDQTEAVYADENVEKAVKQLRAAYPKADFIYYQINDNKPESYIELF